MEATALPTEPQPLPLQRNLPNEFVEEEFVGDHSSCLVSNSRLTDQMRREERRKDQEPVLYLKCFSINIGQRHAGWEPWSSGYAMRLAI